MGSGIRFIANHRNDGDGMWTGGVVRHGVYASGFLALCHTLLSLQGGKLVVNNGETGETP